MSPDSPTDSEGRTPGADPGDAGSPPLDAQTHSRRLRQLSEGKAELYGAQRSTAEQLLDSLSRTEAERREIDFARLGELGLGPHADALDLTRIVREGATTKDLLQVVLAQAVRLYEARKATVLVPDEAGHELLVAASETLGQPVHEQFRIKLGEGVAGRVFETGEPAIIEDTSQCDYYIPGREGGIKSTYLVCVPLKVEDDVLGVLSLERPLGLPATDEKIRQLLRYAEQASVQLRNIFSYESLLKQISELSVLCDISRELSSSLEHTVLLQKIVESACELLHCEICSLMLFEDDKQTLRIRYAVGLSEEVVANAVARTGEGVTGWVAERGEPLLIEDITQDPRFAPDTAQERRQSKRYRTRSLLSVPLKIGTEVVGVLNVNNKANNAVFSGHDRSNLLMLASQAAVSIENARLYETLQRLAVTDPLTKLFRRNYFEEQLVAELGRCRRYDRPLSVMMLDIDHFKSVNDTYGHQAGDAVLRGLAGLLRRYGRKDDLIARYGGEEFVVYLVETDVEGARMAGERVRQATEAYRFDIGQDEPLRITVSLGYASFPEHGDEVTSLIQRADLALYAAKSGGRNQVVGYEPGMVMTKKHGDAADGR